MNDIAKKSIGFLIDELITTDMKCWFAQEMVMSGGGTDSEIAEAAKKAQRLNVRRNALIRAIDEKLGETDISATDKTYS